MIIDSCAHVGNSLFGRELSPQELILNMDKLGIDKAVIVPFKPYDYHFEPANEYVAEQVEAYPDRFIGFGRVDPWRRDLAVKEVERIFDRLNLSGLFLHPREENCPITAPAARFVLLAALERNKPVMVAGGFKDVSHPRQVEYIAGEFPDLTFIVTSAGQINISGALMWDAEEMLKACPNVIACTSGVYRRDFIENITRVIGVSRVVFGSFAPYFDQELEMDRIKTADLTDSEKEAILGKNLEKILHPE